VLYVHGGTFPSALSIAHRFGGTSWRDELSVAGYHVWGLDFHGFGCFSDPYPKMVDPAERHPPLGRAEEVSRQLESAVRFICTHQGVPRLSLVAHSWGTIVSGHFAGRCPESLRMNRREDIFDAWDWGLRAAAPAARWCCGSL
jgi:pimeloyl-ACP methyl ester carboxylesterase